MQQELLLLLGIGLGVAGTLLSQRTILRPPNLGATESWVCEVLVSINGVTLNVKEENTNRSWSCAWAHGDPEPQGWPESAPKDWSRQILDETRSCMEALPK